MQGQAARGIALELFHTKPGMFCTLRIVSLSMPDTDSSVQHQHKKPHSEPAKDSPCEMVFKEIPFLLKKLHVCLYLSFYFMPGAMFSRGLKCSASETGPCRG